MVKQFAITLLLSTLTSFYCNGQSLPVGISPMEFNSSFAGMTGKPRLVTNFTYSTNSSNNLASINENGWRERRNNYFISLDNFFSKIGTGIGLTAYHSNTSRTGYTMVFPPGFRDTFPSNLTAPLPPRVKTNYDNQFSHLSLAIAPKCIQSKQRERVANALHIRFNIRYAS